MQKRIKYQSKLVTIGSSTAANTTTDTDIQLDKSYDLCTGIAVHEVSDGGIANSYYRAAIKDQNKSYHDLAHIDNFKANGNVAPDQKFKNIDLPITDGQLVSIQINNPAVLASDLIVEVVFRLEYYEQEVG